MYVFFITLLLYNVSHFVGSKDIVTLLLYNVSHFVGSKNIDVTNLSPRERAQIVLKLKPKLREEARERQVLGGKSKLPQNSAEPEVRDQLANLANVSHDTIAKVEYIEKKATPEQIEKLNKVRKFSHLKEKIKGEKY